MTAQQRIEQLESFNLELLRLIRELKQLMDDSNSIDELQGKGNQLYELALTLEDIQESDVTVNQWMGRYLLGAKAEAKRIVTEALSLAPILQEPAMPPLVSLALSNERTVLAEEKGHVATPLTRLSEVSKRYQTQCDSLLDELADSVDSPLLQKKEEG